MKSKWEAADHIAVALAKSGHPRAAVAVTALFRLPFGAVGVIAVMVAGFFLR